MRLTSICVLLALLAGCRAEGRPADADPGPAVERMDVLAMVPTLERSAVMDTVGAEDAQKHVLFVLQDYDSVLQFYRTRLPRDSWRIMSDEGDTVATVIRAERDSLLLWVQVRKAGLNATAYTLIAGVEPTQRPGPVMARP